MRNTIIIAAIFMFISITTFAKQASEIKAKQVAISFFEQNKINKSGKEITFEVSYTEYSKKEPLFYVLNRTQENGFAIVSAIDNRILAYSFKNNFNTENMPSFIKAILNNFKEELINYSNSTINATNKSTNAVSPLLTTEWGEKSPYNSKIVNGTDPFPSKVGGAGVAMSQLMKYHEYPTTGEGSINYYHYQFGSIIRNFNHTYNWSNMPNTITENNDDISNLMYDAGASVVTVFKYYAETTEYFTTINPGAEENKSVYTSFLKSALETNFKYSSDSEYKYRTDFTDQTWLTLIKNQLDLLHPVILFGNIGVPHYWVCDGYDSSNKLHQNFGLDGEYNGFYPMTDNGTGEYALVNIYPDTYTNTAEITNSEINIYPNPSKGIFNILINENLNNSELTIYNSIGNIILQKNISSSQTSIDLSEQSKGMYFVKITDANTTTIKQIIIE